MSVPTAPASRRPVIVSIAVVLVFLSGLSSAAVGVFILLSRYRVDAAAVLPVSLLGAAVILFGLLTIAVGGAVRRGSGLARLLLTLYLACAVVLHVVTLVTSDAWDWTAVMFIVIDLFIVYALWAPPGSHFFREVTAAQRAVSEAIRA